MAMCSTHAFGKVPLGRLDLRIRLGHLRAIMVSRLLQKLRQLLPSPARGGVRVHRRRGDHRMPERLLNVL
jgi:hypothetical protein